MPFISGGGGGGAFNGGTITEGLEIADPDVNETQLRITMATGSSAAGATVLEVVDDFGTTIAEIDADGTYVFKLEQAFSTFLVFDGTGGGTLIEGEPGGKLAFFGATSVTRPASADIAAALQSLGLVAAGARGATFDAGIKSGQQTSGALSTLTLASGTGRQISTASDRETHTPVTFNPGVATTATCTVELSSDNVTYSTLAVVTKPVGTVFDGTIEDVVVRVPAGWYIKLTVNAQATLGTTTYY